MDSLELILIVKGLRFDLAEQIMLTSADVNALYPSIQLERVSLWIITPVSTRPSRTCD